MLCALRCAIDNEHRRRHSHDIQDAHEGFLADEARDPPAERQQNGAKQGEQKCVGKPRRAQRRVAYGKRNCGAQRRQLGKR